MRGEAPLVTLRTEGTLSAENTPRMRGTVINPQHGQGTPMGRRPTPSITNPECQLLSWVWDSQRRTVNSQLWVSHYKLRKKNTSFFKHGECSVNQYWILKGGCVLLEKMLSR